MSSKGDEGDSAENCQDGDDDNEFDEGETEERFSVFLERFHGITLESVEHP